METNIYNTYEVVIGEKGKGGEESVEDEHIGNIIGLWETAGSLKTKLRKYRVEIRPIVTYTMSMSANDEEVRKGDNEDNQGPEEITERTTLETEI